MIGREDLLRNLNSIYPYIISLPNGDEATALKEGTVHLNPELKIHSVLFIPEFKCNLISLAQLARKSKCFVTLFDNLCIIQDRTLMRLIRVGEKRNRIYFYKLIVIIFTCLFYYYFWFK